MAVLLIHFSSKRKVALLLRNICVIAGWKVNQYIRFKNESKRELSVVYYLILIKCLMTSRACIISG
jgi:hypothetical protein